MKTYLDTDTAIEPSHYPHMHRMWIGDFSAPKAVALVTQNDGTQRMLLTSVAPLHAEIDRSDAAEEGGKFREPAPTRDPDHVRATWRDTLLVIGTPTAILLIVAAVWAYRTWLA